MGKKGSILVPFLVKGLKKNKYGQYLTGDINDIIQIILPRKTKNLSCESMKILKDWSFKKGRAFKNEKDYTKAKQGMLAALRRSDYLERVKEFKPALCYRILSNDEVKDKKLKQKAKKKLAPLEEILSPSSVESGFESSVESPLSTDLSSEMENTFDDNSVEYDSAVGSPYLNEFECPEELMSYISIPQSLTPTISECVSDLVFTTKSILNAINHDHDFGFQLNFMRNQNVIAASPVETVISDEEMLDIDETGYFTEDYQLTESEFQYLLNDSSLLETSFNDITIKPEDKQILKEARLLKFKSEQLIGETTLLTCEPTGEVLLYEKSGFDSIPLDNESSERLQPFQVVEVKEQEDNILFLFSDFDLIALGSDISKRLNLSLITEVKRVGNYVLLFSKSSKVYWE